MGSFHWFDCMQIYKRPRGGILQVLALHLICTVMHFVCACVCDILFQVHPEFHWLQQELSLGTYSSDSTIILGFLSIVALTASVVVGFCNVLLFTMGNLSLAVFSSEALIFAVLFFSPGDAVRLSCFPCWLWGCCFGPRLPSSFTVLAMYITT